MSYAALLKARRTLKQAEAQSDESESSWSDAEELVDDAGKPESSSKAGQREAPRKRSNKHAYVLVSLRRTFSSELYHLFVQTGGNECQVSGLKEEGSSGREEKGELSSAF